MKKDTRQKVEEVGGGLLLAGAGSVGAIAMNKLVKNGVTDFVNLVGGISMQVFSDNKVVNQIGAGVTSVGLLGVLAKFIPNVSQINGVDGIVGCGCSKPKSAVTINGVGCGCNKSAINGIRSNGIRVNGLGCAECGGTCGGSCNGGCGTSNPCSCGSKPSNLSGLGYTNAENAWIQSESARLQALGYKVTRIYENDRGNVALDYEKSTPPGGLDATGKPVVLPQPPSPYDVYGTNATLKIGSRRLVLDCKSKTRYEFAYEEWDGYYYNPIVTNVNNYGNLVDSAEFRVYGIRKGNRAMVLFSTITADPTKPIYEQFDLDENVWSEYENITVQGTVYNIMPDGSKTSQFVSLTNLLYQGYCNPNYIEKGSVEMPNISTGFDETPPTTAPPVTNPPTTNPPAGYVPEFRLLTTCNGVDASGKILVKAEGQFLDNTTKQWKTITNSKDGFEAPRLEIYDTLTGGILGQYNVMTLSPMIYVFATNTPNTSVNAVINWKNTGKTITNEVQCQAPAVTDPPVTAVAYPEIRLVTNCAKREMNVVSLSAELQFYDTVTGSWKTVYSGQDLFSWIEFKVFEDGKAVAFDTVNTRTGQPAIYNKVLNLNKPIESLTINANAQRNMLFKDVTQTVACIGAPTVVNPPPTVITIPTPPVVTPPTTIIFDPPFVQPPTLDGCIYLDAGGIKLCCNVIPPDTKNDDVVIDVPPSGKFQVEVSTPPPTIYPPTLPPGPMVLVTYTNDVIDTGCCEEDCNRSRKRKKKKR